MNKSRRPSFPFFFVCRDFLLQPLSLAYPPNSSFLKLPNSPFRFWWFCRFRFVPFWFVSFDFRSPLFASFFVCFLWNLFRALDFAYIISFFRVCVINLWNFELGLVSWGCFFFSQFAKAPTRTLLLSKNCFFDCWVLVLVSYAPDLDWFC